MTRHRQRSPRVVRATVWREAAQLHAGVRQRFYARRCGYSLFVLVIRVDQERSYIWARLDDPRLEDGVDVARNHWHHITRGTMAATVVSAQRWAEQRADEMEVTR